MQSEKIKGLNEELIKWQQMSHSEDQMAEMLKDEAIKSEEIFMAAKDEEDQGEMIEETLQLSEGMHDNEQHALKAVFIKKI